MTKERALLIGTGLQKLRARMLMGYRWKWSLGVPEDYEKVSSVQTQ